MATASWKGLLDPDGDQMTDVARLTWAGDSYTMRMMAVLGEYM